MTRTASPRGAHDAKLTVYVSPAERAELEVAVARLRAEGLRVDRGRFIRAAVAGALDALEQPGGRRGLLARLQG